jgi:hypothetical protein
MSHFSRTHRIYEIRLNIFWGTGHWVRGTGWWGFNARGKQAGGGGEAPGLYGLLWVPLFFLGLLGLLLGGGLSGFCWVPVGSTFRLGVVGAASQAAR